MNNDMNVILICPCCATPKDVAVLAHGVPGWAVVRLFTCAACGQAWHMGVDTDRFKEHALT